MPFSRRFYPKRLTIMCAYILHIGCVSIWENKVKHFFCQGQPYWRVSLSHTNILVLFVSIVDFLWSSGSFRYGKFAPQVWNID
jgi:hypothetical protein